MSPTGTNSHTFTPNGDVLARGEFVRVRKKWLGLMPYTRTHFRLGQEHVYDGPTFCVKAPSGYQFDGATVPRPLWMIFERFGPWSRAALYHDILYDRRIGDKLSADALFLEVMRHDKVGVVPRYLMFLAVALWPPNIWYWYREPKTRASGYRKAKSY